MTVLDKFYSDLELQKASCKHPADSRYMTSGSFDIELNDTETLAALEEFFGQKIDLELMKHGQQIKAGLTRMEIRPKVVWNENLIWSWLGVERRGGYEYLGKSRARYWHERPVTFNNH